MQQIVLPLASAEATIARAGGKGANLAELVRAGFNVPAGFIITTGAYRAFVAANELAPRILALAKQATPGDPAVLEESSARIRRLFEQGAAPPAITGPILEAYHALVSSAMALQRSSAAEFSVAVRSSATAEDLPGLSFAGQHETYLNIRGEQALLDGVKRCWGSLWTTQALGYRARNDISQQEVELAVVVQALVPAEVAGVLFTANPLTGRRGEIVIDAGFGLGEAVVSGEVEPDHYVVDSRAWRVTERRLRAGTLTVLAGSDSDVSRVPASRVSQALSDEQIVVLARLAQRVGDHFGSPQDIEWASAGGQFHILQARPITALPEPPHDRKAAVPARYSRMQRMGAPMALDHITQPPYPFDYSLFLRPVMLRARRALRSLGIAIPSPERIFVEVAEGVVQMVPPTMGLTPRVLALPLKLVASLRMSPNVWLEECRRTLVARALDIDREELATRSDLELLQRIEELQRLLLGLFVRRFAYFPRGMLATQGLGLLLRLAVGREAARLLADLLAGVPSTTTAANQELTRLARFIRASAELRQVFKDESPQRIPVGLSRSAAGRALVSDVEGFLERFGYRESGMPSAAQPAWRDEPTIVYGLLKSLAAGEAARAQAAGDDMERAARSRQEVVGGLSRGRFGLRRRLLLPLFRGALKTAREFIAYREDSHFYLFLPFPVIRRLALELGRRLVQRGLLQNADDVFLLRFDELRRLGPAAEVQDKVQRRSSARQAVEGRYTPIPLELLETTNVAGEVHGVPVSSGRAAGRVRIIKSERDFWKLQRGEVLVARYTNSAWTPLFALAGAVVVDAGGMASHAAIVAREYGIPAVMGTRNATLVLRDGQRVLVDGDKGRVVLIG